MTAPVATLLLTRPEPAARSFLDSLDPDHRDRIVPVISPLIEIAVPGGEIPTDGVAGLIFTSANGVRAVADRIGARDLPAWCVGAATARMAAAAGWTAHVAGPDAAAMVERLKAVQAAGPLLHLRGRQARGDVAERLSQAGIPTGERVVYDQIARPLSDAARQALDGANPVLAPVFSPRTGRLFRKALPARAPLRVAAISRAAAEPFEDLGDVVVDVAVAPDAPSLRDLVQRQIDEASRVVGTGGRE